MIQSFTDSQISKTGGITLEALYQNRMCNLNRTADVKGGRRQSIVIGMLTA